MQHTWASGAIELLRHADSHINLETAFDGRVAFISIDNAVETMMRTFLSLPSSKSGTKVPRKELEAVENSFPGLTALLWKHVAKKLTGIDDADIEHYHRIRKKLYHEGTGLFERRCWPRVSKVHCEEVLKQHNRNLSVSQQVLLIDWSRMAAAAARSRRACHG
jgi:hypothetical protein